MARPGTGGLHQISSGTPTWRDEGLWISSCWGRRLGMHPARSSPNSVGWALPLSGMLMSVLQVPGGPSLPM